MILIFKKQFFLRIKDKKFNFSFELTAKLTNKRQNDSTIEKLSNKRGQKMDKFLNEKFYSLSNQFNIKNIDIIYEFCNSKFYGNQFIQEYFIQRSNKELTVYIIYLWMCVLNDRDFNEKADLISKYILGETYEEFEIDVAIVFNDENLY